MDKYTKFILTMIAVGILGLNYHLFKGEIISEAKAATGDVQKVAICNEKGNTCVAVGIANEGDYGVLMTSPINY